MAAYRERTKIQRQEYGRAYREANRHYFILKAAEYNARKRGNLVEDVPNEFLDHLCQWQDMKCFYCGSKLTRSSKTKELEHIIPVTKGGMNSSANLVWACLSCNDKKYNYLYGSEWGTEKVVENIKFYNHCASSTLASDLGGHFKSGIVTISWLKVIVLSSFGLSFGYPELSIEDIKTNHPDAVLIWDFVLDQNTNIVKDYILSLLDENISMQNELEPLVVPYKDQEYVYVNAEGSHDPYKFNSENGPTWLLHYDESRTEEENALTHGYRKLYLY